MNQITLFRLTKSQARFLFHTCLSTTRCYTSAVKSSSASAPKSPASVIGLDDEPTKFRASTPPSGVPLSKILSNTFPLPVRESFKHYFKRRKLDEIQNDLLSILPFFPHPSSTHQSQIIKTIIDDNGNYINELHISPLNPAPDAKHLIVIHGYGAGLGFFVKNLEKLAESKKDWHIHAIDLPGYGCSSRFTFPHSIPYEDNITVEKLFTDALHQWFKKRNLTNTPNLVAAHSMGAYLSAILNFSQPELFQKLIFISPGGIHQSYEVNVPSWFANLWNLNYSPFALVRNSGPFGSMFVSGWTSRRLTKNHYFLNVEEQEKLHLYTYAIFNAKGSGEYMLNYLLAPGGSPRKPLLERITNLKCDSSWLYGENDWMDKVGGLESCKRLISKGLSARFVVVPDSGHQIFLDNFKEFNKLIIDEMGQFDEKY